MPVSFNSSSDFSFSNLGLTSSLSGITLKITAYDQSSGSTVVTSVVPTSLNYILGSAISDSVTSSSYQTISNGILSLTTQSSRIVEISLIPDTSNGYLEIGNPQFTSCAGQLRVLRGPSLVIGEAEIISELSGNTTAYVARVPCSSFRVMDFSPISGSATYILQASAIGTSSQILLNGAKLFVRQL